MNITAQHVTPEEVMALLDGELLAADAQSVSAHVDDCAECSKLTEQLRSASQSLSAWKVPALPARMEDSVAELAAKAGAGAEIKKSNLFIRTSFWSWKQWTGLSAGAAMALLFLVAIFMPVEQAHYAASPQIASSVVAKREERQTFDRYSDGKPPATPGRVAGAGGDRDKLPMKVGGALGGLIGDYAPPQGLDGQPAPAEEGVSAPMIARTVSLAIMVKDFAASRSSLDAILTRYHAYSAQLSVSTRENAPRGLQASLRIPASALAAAVGELKTLGRVEKESQSGEEVTRQHEDLIARLRNSRETEHRLREILQQRTGKITDVLKVEEEIARVRGEIEEMEAEQKALEHRVDFAAVELQLAEEYKAQLNPLAPSVATRIHNAFVAGYQNITETLLGILLFFVEYGPALFIWLAILALPVGLMWRRYRRISAEA
ncbi:MAG: hypothetical protein DMG60_11945 [Acidobacteria bacterium]|nr:MAG: hypothetical protein DMG60_11945 [Acidobacteriota bacterium]